MEIIDLLDHLSELEVQKYLPSFPYWITRGQRVRVWQISSPFCQKNSDVTVSTMETLTPTVGATKTVPFSYIHQGVNLPSRYTLHLIPTVRRYYVL